MNKAQNYLRACDRLSEAVRELSAEAGDELRRDGLIQRFEFTFELAWKSLKEYLEAQGYAELTTPRTVLREAFAARLIDDEAAWLAMLDARNRTSHIYDEGTAAEIAGQISAEFFPPLSALAKFYRGLNT